MRRSRPRGGLHQGRKWVGPPDAEKTGGPVSPQLKLRAGSAASLASLGDGLTCACARQRDPAFNLTGQGSPSRKAPSRTNERTGSVLALFLFSLVLVLLFILLLVLAAVGKASIPQSGADGQNAPVLHVLHERHFGKSLCHTIIVH